MMEYLHPLQHLFEANANAENAKARQVGV